MVKTITDMDLREKYLLELDGILSVLTSEAVKEKIGNHEKRFIEAAEDFMGDSKSTADAVKFSAVELALKALCENEKVSEVVPFNELKTDFLRSAPEAKEMVFSQNYSTLLPTVVAGGFVPTVEWEYIGSRILGRRRVQTTSTSVEMYVTTPLKAGWVGEAKTVPEAAVDIQALRKLQVNIREFGVGLAFSRQALRDAMWPVLETNISAANGAMNRFREEFIWTTFKQYAHTIFDPDDGRTAFATSGVDGTYTANNTLSIYDYLDLVASLQLQGFKATDIFFHPLHYLVFAKTAIRGGMFLPEANKAAIAGSLNVGKSPDFDSAAINSMISAQLGGLIPNIWTTPFIPFDVNQMKADVYVIDRSNVGTVLEREGLRRIEWQDLGVEIRHINFRDEMGVAIFHDGKAIAKAANLAVDVGYSMDTSFVYNLGN